MTRRPGRDDHRSVILLVPFLGVDSLTDRHQVSHAITSRNIAGRASRAHEDATAGRRPWPDHRVWLPAAAAVFFIFLIGAACQLPQRWYPSGDFALFELAVRQIGHSALLVGPYSRGRGFNHPSPAFYYLSWLPYQLSGERSSSLLATTLVFNGAVLSVGVWLTARRYAAGLAVTLVGCLTIYSLTSRLSLLSMPWNPYVAAIPLLVLILTVWRLCLGCRWALPFAVGLASWCTGNHLGYAPCALGVLLLGGAGLVVHERREPDVRWARLAWPVAASIVVGLVVWAPTLLDVALHRSDSNAVAILRFLEHPKTAAVPPGDAVRVLFSELSFRPYWAGGPRPFRIFSPGAFEPPLFALVIVAGVVFAYRRRAADELVGMAVGAAALLFAFVGLLRVNDATLLDWYVLPAQMSAIALVAFTVWSLVRTGRWLFAERHSVTNDQLPRSLLAPAVTVLAVVALGAITVANLAVPADIAGQGRSVVAMVPMIEGKVPKIESVELRADYNLDSFIPPTMLLALERAGYSALVPVDEAFRYGTWRARATSGPRTQLDLKTFGNTSAPPTPTAVLVATGLPLPVPLNVVGESTPTLWLLPHVAGSAG